MAAKGVPSQSQKLIRTLRGCCSIYIFLRAQWEWIIIKRTLIFLILFVIKSICYSFACLAANRPLPKHRFTAKTPLYAVQILAIKKNSLRGKIRTQNSANRGGRVRRKRQSEGVCQGEKSGWGVKKKIIESFGKGGQGGGEVAIFLIQIRVIILKQKKENWRVGGRVAVKVNNGQGQARRRKHRKKWLKRSCGGGEGKNRIKFVDKRMKSAVGAYFNIYLLFSSPIILSCF